MKTRNGIIFSPHPNAKKSTAEAARIVLEAAVEAGAPKNIIACIENPKLRSFKSLDATQRHLFDLGHWWAGDGEGWPILLGHLQLVWARGNTPALIDETA